MLMEVDFAVCLLFPSIDCIHNIAVGPFCAPVESETWQCTIALSLEEDLPPRREASFSGKVNTTILNSTGLHTH